MYYVLVNMADRRLANCIGEIFEWFLKLFLGSVAYASAKKLVFSFFKVISA